MTTPLHARFSLLSAAARHLPKVAAAAEDVGKIAGAVGATADAAKSVKDVISGPKEPEESDKTTWQAMAYAFDEAKHNRDAGGQFAPKGQVGGGGSAETAGGKEAADLPAFEPDVGDDPKDPKNIAKRAVEKDENIWAIARELGLDREWMRENIDSISFHVDRFRRKAKEAGTSPARKRAQLKAKAARIKEGIEGTKANMAKMTEQRQIDAHKAQIASYKKELAKVMQELGEDDDGFELKREPAKRAKGFETTGKGKQQALFGKSGKPGQKNLFADVAVPDDMVQGGEKPKKGPPKQKKLFQAGMGENLQFPPGTEDTGMAFSAESFTRAVIEKYHALADGSLETYRVKATEGQKGIEGVKSDVPRQKRFGWITIGGDKSAPEGTKGGTPVFIGDDGTIKAGPKGLEGRKIGSLDRDVAGTDKDKRKDNEPPSTPKDKPKPPPGKPAKKAEPAKSILEQRRELKRQLDAGEITADEFDERDDALAIAQRKQGQGEAPTASKTIKDLPQGVQDFVRRQADILDDVATEMQRAEDLDDRLGGGGRYVSDVWNKLGGSVAGAHEQLDKFRKIAKENDIDPEAILDELGLADPQKPADFEEWYPSEKTEPSPEDKQKRTELMADIGMGLQTGRTNLDVEQAVMKELGADSIGDVARKLKEADLATVEKIHKMVEDDRKAQADRAAAETETPGPEPAAPGTDAASSTKEEPKQATGQAQTLADAWSESERTENEGSFESQTRRNYADRFISTIDKNLPEGTWKQTKELEKGPYTRISRGAIGRDLSKMAKKGLLQIAWDKDGYPHYAKPGAEVPDNLATQDEIDAAGGEFPEGKTAEPPKAEPKPAKPRKKRGPRKAARPRTTAALREASAGVVGGDKRDQDAFIEMVKDYHMTLEGEIRSRNSQFMALLNNFGIKGGSGVGALVANARKWGDPDQIPKFDEMVEMAARDYPEALGVVQGESSRQGEDAEQALFERITKGGLEKIPPMHDPGVIEQVAAQLPPDWKPFAEQEEETEPEGEGGFPWETDDFQALPRSLQWDLVKYHAQTVWAERYAA